MNHFTTVSKPVIGSSLTERRIRIALSKDGSMKTIFLTLFLGANALLRVSSQEITWIRTKGPLTDAYEVRHVLVTKSGIALAASDKYGLFRSLDSGLTWNRITEIEGASVSALAMSDSGFVYASLPSGNLSKSSDGGLNWFRIQAKFRCNVLAVDGTNHLYGSSYGDLKKSTDDGKTWKTIFAVDGVRSLAVREKTLVCVAWNSSTDETTLSVSSDLGLTWTKRNPSNEVERCYLTNEGILFVQDVWRLYRSSNLGIDYDTIHTFGSKALSFAQSTSSTIFASQDAGMIVQSNDSGKSWTRRSNAPLLHSIAVLNDQYLFGGANRSRIMRFDLRKDRWDTTQLGENRAEITGLHVTPTNVLLVGSHSGHHWSSDGGYTWDNRSSPPLLRSFVQLNKDSLFTAGVGIGVYLFSGAQVRQRIVGLDIDVWDILWHPKGFLFSTNQFWGVHRSSNYGEYWVETNLRTSSTYEIELDTGGNLYATSNSIVMRSTDLGDSWEALPAQPASSYLMPLLITRSKRIFTGYDDIHMSSDGGNTWNASGLASIRLERFFELPNGIILAATTTHGVLASRDSGKTWIETNAGLSQKYVTSFALDSNGYLYTGGNDGVYRSSHSITSVSDIPNRHIPSEIEIHDLHPNPYSRAHHQPLTLRFSLSTRDIVSLSIFNALGEEVANVLNGETYEGGTHLLRISSHNLKHQVITPGVYFIRMHTSRNTVTKKIIFY